jgi:hypothetical protein
VHSRNPQASTNSNKLEKCMQGSCEYPRVWRLAAAARSGVAAACKEEAAGKQTAAAAIALCSIDDVNDDDLFKTEFHNKKSRLQ